MKLAECILFDFDGTVYDTVCTEAQLSGDATLHISAADGQPLLWEHAESLFVFWH